ncbi:hypothetical protein ACOMHN_022930 [Nucella lapillus]
MKDSGQPSRHHPSISHTEDPVSVTPVSQQCLPLYPGCWSFRLALVLSGPLMGCLDVLTYRPRWNITRLSHVATDYFQHRALSLCDYLQQICLSLYVRLFDDCCAAFFLSRAE